MFLDLSFSLLWKLGNGESWESYWKNKNDKPFACSVQYLLLDRYTEISAHLTI